MFPVAPCVSLYLCFCFVNHTSGKGGDMDVLFSSAKENFSSAIRYRGVPETPSELYLSNPSWFPTVNTYLGHLGFSYFWCRITLEETFLPDGQVISGSSHTILIALALSCFLALGRTFQFILCVLGSQSGMWWQPNLPFWMSSLCILHLLWSTCPNLHNHLELEEDAAPELELQRLDYVQFIERLLGYLQFIKRIWDSTYLWWKWLN